MGTGELVQECLRKKQELEMAMKKLATEVSSENGDKEAMRILFSSLIGNRDISLAIFRGLNENKKISKDYRIIVDMVASIMGLPK